MYVGIKSEIDIYNNFLMKQKEIKRNARAYIVKNHEPPTGGGRGKLFKKHFFKKKSKEFLKIFTPWGGMPPDWTLRTPLTNAVLLLF